MEEKDYKKLYEDVVALAKDGLKDGLYLSQSAKAVTEFLFPQLKETEEEKARKGLVRFLINFNNGCYSKPSEAEIDAWIKLIDKKCEQKPVECVKLDNEFENQISHLIASVLNGEHEYNEGFVKYASQSLLGFANKDQNPTNKVEPKFKVGDWITNGACIIKITSVDDRYYWHDNDCVGGDIESIDKEYHLWTIQDAKDGDVLAEHETIVLFKEIDGLNIRCYCTYNYLGCDPTLRVDTLHNKNPYRPATKEQRDLLFQKMKEAGYEWDAEKKELNKIEKQGEQKPIIIIPKFKIGDIIKPKPYNEEHLIKDINENGYVLDVDIIVPFKDEDIWEIVEQKTTWSKEDENSGKKSEDVTEEKDMTEYKKGFECGKQRVLKYPEDFNLCKKHATWSEDDEAKLRDVIRLVEQGAPVRPISDHYTNWLKSLKDRFQLQPKQEWSKEDSERLARIHKFIWANRKGDTDEIYQQEQDADWIMSIIPQQNQYDKGYNDGYSAAKYNQWKPTDKQMEDFRMLLDYNIGVFDYAKFMSADSLYEDLKKNLID